MTQFALFKINRQEIIGDCLVKLSDLENSFLEEVAKNFFSESQFDNIYCFHIGSSDFDTLFLEAQKKVNLGEDFDQTSLVKLLKSIFDGVEEIVLWYGSDYYDLDSVADVNGFFEKLEASARESSCEAYIYFKKNI